MAKKLSGWKTKGMNRDLSVSAFNPEFAFENRNLRLSTNDGNTAMSWVNEKGPSLIPIYTLDTTEQTSLEGTSIGTAVLNHYLVVFTTETKTEQGRNRQTDRIYRLNYNDDYTLLMCLKLFEGSDLGFSVEHPIETLCSYENENVQKVYWTDGNKQPRVINIAADRAYPPENLGRFDFIPDLELKEEVTVDKILGNGGSFAPGVIQYAFTYYYKYGQETNIFYTTPLYYISHADRGGNPEEQVDNTFKITVNNVEQKFDYLRIYSIQRTSVNATPFVKRIQDISLKDIEENKVSYTDTGFSGDTVDPTELLYKGGEDIIAQTLEQKDNTLFFGNIKMSRNSISNIKDSIIEDIIRNGVTCDTRTIYPNIISTDGYAYGNQLTAKDENDNSVSCAGFKRGDYYRLGVQFQHKSGKWSEPVFIKDFQQDNKPTSAANSINLPVFKATLSQGIATTLSNMDYLKLRPVVVFPEMQDRVVKAQGVGCPTLYTENNRNTYKSIYAQSSWFFRPVISGESTSKNVLDTIAVSPIGLDYRQGRLNATGLNYTFRGTGPVEEGQTIPPEEDGETLYAYNPTYIRTVEVEGDYKEDNKFNADDKTWTLHTPDMEFDGQISIMDMSGFKFRSVGQAVFTNTLSDIEIQTESPTISNSASGFVHRPFSKDNSFGIVSGLFYDDFIVDEDELEEGWGFVAWRRESVAAKWLIYPWQQNSSLNNDVNRPADAGTPTAKLKKKVISNLRFADTRWAGSIEAPKILSHIQAYSSDEATIIKLGDNVYQGNVDTAIIPDHSDGKYFCMNGAKSEITTWPPSLKFGTEETPFDSQVWWKTWSVDPTTQKQNGIRSWSPNSGAWVWAGSDNIGDYYLDLVRKKSVVRMKYKSTPHIVFDVNGTSNAVTWEYANYSLPVLEIVEGEENHSRFGGTSADALRENTWVPCGKPVALKSNSNTPFEYSFGDTYYQRWDCLKTYPFTREDPNQIVEIGSFMLETHVNIDGRYDRNRGQSNNVNMSPVNFNLLNPVYSQKDNFFSYKIMPDDFYDNIENPNQITWSKTKNAGADVDIWTNVTLASTLDLDGDKGAVNELVRFNDQLVAFQDTGVSQILYNDNVQIASTEGVPIEIANSGKVSGKRYVSDTVGCSNKWSIANSPIGIYFMDSIGKNIWLFNGQLTNVSEGLGFNSWAKQTIPPAIQKWTPAMDNSAFANFYDKINNEVLFVNDNDCLAYSEKTGTFTSFYSYEGIPYFCNLDDTGVWIGKIRDAENDTEYKLWKHHAGEYGMFFGKYAPYSTILVANPEPQLDKIFTNLEFRACVDGDGEQAQGASQFTFTLPFDYLETWDEYQHGVAKLENRQGHSLFKHHTKDGIASLKRKFRIWRCDIPRDNVGVIDGKSPFDYTFDDTFHVEGTVSNAHPLDRMRNPWLYLKLMKKEILTEKVEIHDVVLTYFG